MMKSITVLTMILLVTSIASAKNPMKTCIVLLILSSLGFLHLKLKSGVTWFPLTMFMLFTGGILMMFMILSSILPNEKALKNKIPKSWPILFFIVAVSSSGTLTSSSSNLGELKSSLASNHLFELMMGLILMYFFYSIEMNESEQTPMRSLQ